MLVSIRVQPSRLDGRDEYVRMAETATMREVLAELIATAHHYTKVRNRYHRATAWSTSGEPLASVSISPDAVG